MAAGADGAPILRRLRKRSEFLKAARGSRAGRPALSLQAVRSEAEQPGIGLTVTRKVGNAPERNRIRRRLRAAVKACATRFEPRHDYVLIGRREALSAPFATLVDDLASLLRRVHEQKPKRAAEPEPEGSGAQ
jgi:ribonuclease P protein component